MVTAVIAALSVSQGETLPPVSGSSIPGVAQIDAVMLRTMSQIGCTTAQVTINDHGRVCVSRAYGWADQARQVPATPDTLIGIASCEKPIANAATRLLAARGRLSLDASILHLYGLDSQPSILDPRYHSITVRNVLEHKAGWGKDPVGKLAESDRVPFGEWDEHVPTLLSKIVATDALESTPGTQGAYCNFGYDLIRDLLQRILGKHYIEFYRSGLIPGATVPGFWSPSYTGAKPKSVVLEREGGWSGRGHHHRTLHVHGPLLAERRATPRRNLHVADERKSRRLDGDHVLATRRDRLCGGVQRTP